MAPFRPCYCYISVRGASGHRGGSRVHVRPYTSPRTPRRPHSPRDPAKKNPSYITGRADGKNRPQKPSRVEHDHTHDVPISVLPGPLSPRAVPAAPRARTGTHLKHAAPPHVHDLKGQPGLNATPVGPGPAGGSGLGREALQKAHRPPPVNSRARWTLARTDIPDTPPDRPGSPVAPRAALEKIPAGVNVEGVDPGNSFCGSENPFSPHRRRGFHALPAPFSPPPPGFFRGAPQNRPRGMVRDCLYGFWGGPRPPCWVKIVALRRPAEARPATTDRPARPARPGPPALPTPGPFLPRADVGPGRRPG